MQVIFLINNARDALNYRLHESIHPQSRYWTSRRIHSCNYLKDCV